MLSFAMLVTGAFTLYKQQGFSLDYKVLEGNGALTAPFALKSKNMPTVKVSINGKGPFVMGIDTCAGCGGLITKEVSEALKLEEHGEAMSDDGSGHNLKPIILRKATEVKLGPFTFKELPLVQVDKSLFGEEHPEINGVLGFGAFKELLLSLDFKKMKITVGRGLLTSGAKTVPLYPSQVAEVSLCIGGTEKTVRFDTGSDLSLIVPNSEKANLKLITSLQSTVGRTNNSTYEFESATLDGWIMLGHLKIQEPEINFAKSYNSINFGRKLMHGHVFKLDQRSKLMQID